MYSQRDSASGAGHAPVSTAKPEKNQLKAIEIFASMLTLFECVLIFSNEFCR